MPLTIECIAPDSLAEEIGLQPTDKILRINQHPIRDFLDLQFYGGDPVLEIEWQRKGELFSKRIQQTFEHPLGIEPNEHNCRTCINDCIFCFIDQMHPNLRSALYLKDDDIPFSFVFGNFITLTNLTAQDYSRIYEQRLSPLYISIHTTNPILHKKMLRHPLEDFSILQKLKQLAAKGIEYHLQIVLVPGLNDGEELKTTLSELTKPDLTTLSIGIVPVGLTKFRKKLTPIVPVHKQIAERTIAIANKFPNTYLADEFFILAEQPIPAETYYDDYPQLENGIGMLRLLWENWNDVKFDFIEELKLLQKKPVFITGVLASADLQKIADDLQKGAEIAARVQIVRNHFFGETVTVAGLLTAQDIMAQTKINEDEIICVSSNLLNGDMKTLDNVCFEDLQHHFNGQIILIDEEFADWDVITS